MIQDAVVHGLPETLTIDRTRWWRGKDSVESNLLRSVDGKMCCLGFLCLAGGVTPAILANRAMPYNAYRATKDTFPQPLYRALIGKNNFGTSDDSDFSRKAAAINDLPIGEFMGDNAGARQLGVNGLVLESEEHRERLLAELFASVGVRIEFIN